MLFRSGSGSWGQRRPWRARPVWRERRLLRERRAPSPSKSQISPYSYSSCDFQFISSAAICAAGKRGENLPVCREEKGLYYTLNRCFAGMSRCSCKTKSFLSALTKKAAPPWYRKARAAGIFSCRRPVRPRSALVLIVVLVLILVLVAVLVLVVILILILVVLHKRQPPFQKRYVPIVSHCAGHYTARGGE